MEIGVKEPCELLLGIKLPIIWFLILRTIIVLD